MDPNDRTLLRGLLEETKENSRLLKKLVNAQRWTRGLSILKWVIILSLALGSYYYLQPLVEQVIATYQALGVSIPNPNNFGTLLEGWSQ